MISMDAKTLEALKGSIAKWEAIVAGNLADMGEENCPLCNLFIRNTPSCTGCPVRAATGAQGCLGSPYDDWVNLHEDQGDDPKSWFATQPTLVAAAQAELDFLKSLLPEARS